MVHHKGARECNVEAAGVGSDVCCSCLIVVLGYFISLDIFASQMNACKNEFQENSRVFCILSHMPGTWSGQLLA